MMTRHWTLQLARCLARPDATTTALEAHLDALLLWLSNPDNPRAAGLARAIARLGLSRSEAVTRAYARLDQLLFAEPGSAARTLGLAEDAQPTQAKQRYRRLIQVYHPDRHADRTDWATQRTERLNRAFDAFRHSPAGTPAHAPAGGRGQAPWRQPIDRLVTATTMGTHRLRHWFEVQTPTRRWALLALLASCGTGLALAISTAGQPHRPQVLRPPGVPSIQSLPSLGRPAPAPHTATADRPEPAVAPRQTSPEPARAEVAEEGSETGRHPPAERTPAAETAGPETRPVAPDVPPRETTAVPIAPPATDQDGGDAPTDEAALTQPAAPPPAASRPPRPEPLPAATPALTISPASPPAQPVAPSLPTPPTRLAQGLVATPVVPAVGTTTIDCRPVAERLGLFQQAYASGALDQLMALYSPLARENTLATWFAIRQTYADWFAKTTRRRIDFGQLQVKPTANGARCAASAAFRVEYLDGQSSLVTKEGVLQLLFERRGQDLLILRARY